MSEPELLEPLVAFLERLPAIDLPAGRTSIGAGAAALGRDDVDAFLYSMGRSIGPPCQAKHKLAAAAALAAAGHAGPGGYRGRTT